MAATGFMPRIMRPPLCSLACSRLPRGRICINASEISSTTMRVPSHANERPSRYNSWRVTGLLPWGAALFVVGFILRSIGAVEYDNLPIFISSTVFLYAAP